MYNFIHFLNKLIKYSQISLWFILFCLWIFNFFLYFHSIRFNFIDFDTQSILLSHPNLYNENSFFYSIKEIVTYFPREEPLIARDITWAIDSYLFGFKNPVGYHLGNIVLNCFNVVFLFLFIFLNTHSKILSLVISITFSVIPVHVEPICWEMGRKDLLVTFFMLLALIFQTLFLSNGDKKKGRTFYLSTLLFTLMALLSKINALSFFMILAFHQFYFAHMNQYYLPINRHNIKYSCRSILFRITPHFIISIFIYAWYSKIIGAFGVLGRGPSAASFEHIKNLMIYIPISIFDYIKMVFIPFYQFSISYYKPNINMPITSEDLTISALVILIAGLSLMVSFYRRKDLFFYLVFFIILMIPYFNIVYIYIWVANRYIYFSSFCLLTIVSILGFELFQKQNQIIKGFLFSIWLIFICINIFQNKTYQKAWYDNHTMWTYENSLEDPSVMSYGALARSYIKIAEKENNSKNKAVLLEKANEVLDSGIIKFKKLNITISKYFTPEIGYYSKFYYLKGKIAELKGIGLEEQLRYYKQSCDIAKTSYNLYALTVTYYSLAIKTDDKNQKIRLIKESFKYFSDYVRFSSNEYKDYIKNIELLDKYFLTQFKFLSCEIAELRNYLLKKSGKN